MNDKVMVTGGAGFVGSHMVDLLLAKGYDVHVMDCIPFDDARWLHPVADNENFHYSQCDIRDEGALREWYQEDAKYIFHLASTVGVHLYMRDPLSLVDISIMGTRSIIKLAVEHGTRMIFTSTSEVYGKNPKVPWSEDDDRVLGGTSIDRWSYSSSKAVCEHMLFGAHRVLGLDMSIIRFFNVYGPRQNPFYVASQSVHCVVNGNRPVLYDGGEQTRCFTYIDDVIGGIFAVAESPKATGEVFNIGNPIEWTMSDAIKCICEKAGVPFEVDHFNTEKEFGKVYEDIPRRVPSVDKARDVLGWEPTTPFDEGIAKTIQWARETQWWLDLPAGAKG